MDTNLDISGYLLQEISPDRWVLQIKSDKYLEGQFKKVVEYAVLKLGFEIKEIETAVEEMLKLDNNTAHFGMYKKFMFTSNKELRYTKKVS